MASLKICRICLRTEAKGHNFERYQLKYYYEEVTAQQVNDDELPHWFCYECSAMLYKFHKFKEKCYLGQKWLKELLWKGPITYEAIYKLDEVTKQLQSSLQTIIVTDRVKTFNIKEPALKNNIKTEESITKTIYSEQKNAQLNENALDMKSTNDPSISVENNQEFDNGNSSTNVLNYNICDISENPFSPISILVQDDKVVNIKSEDMKPNKNKNVELSLTFKEVGKYLNEENWKKIILTEEEAIKEFRWKAEDPKYLDAAYKCTDCFKGFSKKDMLSRHKQSKHSEELGCYECRLCRMKFKWQCHLRRHYQQHYTKYECLRCHITFHLDTSALLHEEYHSGVTKKCLHCNEEFRHITTYYTHMRTHRSAHVCVRCGASFVSRAGLRQHAGSKHAEHQIDSPSTEEWEPDDSYCSRCDLRFHSSRALREHLFHSNMHVQEIKKEDDDDVAPTRKIMGKRLREKITNELKKRKSEIDLLPPVKVKRRKRVKRKHRKPSTCYQCGAEFSTQAACMKHHVTAHPRTSFHAPNDRHICELCGASLAPGSVAVHQNMHSRERVHTCDTCGRQFHSAVGFKRHLVTHTGEKPFACPLCEKRFTQSNSMKLHYKTFHLKQPYPKRIRKKKKDLSQSTEQDDTYDGESDSISQPEPAVAEAPPPLPEVPAPEIPANNLDTGLEEENMHYLTLG